MAQLEGVIEGGAVINVEIIGTGPQGRDGYTPIKGVDYFDGVDGTDGKDGKDGKDGYTPVKGVDYFDGEKGEKGEKGDPGYTPQRGTDYWTATDIAEINAYIDQKLGVIENGTY